MSYIDSVTYQVSSGDRKGVGESVNYHDLGFIPLYGEGGESVAFLSAYLDESYGKGKPNLVVGGFVSDVNRWAEFASRWKVAVQEQFKSSSGFHTFT